jgi:hypothetical protein
MAVVVGGAHLDDELVVRAAWVRVACRHAGQGLVADQVGDGHTVASTEHRELEGDRDEGGHVLVEGLFGLPPMFIGQS